MLDSSAWLGRLASDGLVERTPDGARLTLRWHAAVARAALALYSEGQVLEDMRVPLARVLIDFYGDDPPESIAVALGAVLPLVERDLA